MIQACLYLLAGMYGLQLSSSAPGSDLTALALVAGFVALFLDKWRGPSWLFVGIGLFAFAAAWRLDDRLDETYEGDSIVATVRIADFPRQRGATLSFVAEPQGDSSLPARLRISWFEPQWVPELGDTWQFELRLRRPRGNLNPGVFDYEAWLFRSGVGATGYVVEGHRNRLLPARDSGLIVSYRRHFVARVSELLPDEAAAAVLAAIAVGARHQISREQWDRYARTGTSHLMAISGLHIGLAAAAGYLLARLLVGIRNVRAGNHIVATLAGLAVAGCYGLVSGFGLPSQRAMIMLVLVALAVLRRREVRPYRTLAAAGLVLAITGPIETMDPGFKLSFAAVLLLVWQGGQRRGRPAAVGRSRWLPAAGQVFGLQLALLFGLMPLTVSIFSRAALPGPAVNFVAVPVFSFVTVPCTLAGMVLDGPLRVAGDQCLRLAALSIRAIEHLVTAAANLPGADFTIPQLRGAAELLLLLPPLWVLLPRGWPGRGLAGLGALAIILYQPSRPPHGCFEFEVLDVGQGLAVAVHTATHVLLYDTGPAFRSGSNMVETVVLPYLAAQRLGRIDTLVVSHADSDHAGGVQSLLASIPTEKILGGEMLRGVNRQIVPCRAGMAWWADGVQFGILHPAGGSQFAGNDASCVLVVAAGSGRLLISGDIEAAAERSLLGLRSLDEVTVAVVPHHGSKTSSTPEYVAAIAPDVAIVSAAHGNRWGLPSPEIVDRWQAGGAAVLSTAVAGAVGGRLCQASGLDSIRQFRTDRSRIWHE